MLKIRRPLGRLIFNMGIAIPGKTVFLIETAPWSVCIWNEKSIFENGICKWRPVGLDITVFIRGVIWWHISESKFAQVVTQLPDGNKSSPERMLIYLQRCSSVILRSWTSSVSNFWRLYFWNYRDELSNVYFENFGCVITASHCTKIATSVVATYSGWQMNPSNVQFTTIVVIWWPIILRMLLKQRGSDSFTNLDQL